MFSRSAVAFLVLISSAGAAAAATVSGIVSDPTGATVPGALVVLRGLATGEASSVETGADGRFSLETSSAGTYLVIVTRPGFSEAARTVVVSAATDAIDLPVELEVGGLKAEDLQLLEDGKPQKIEQFYMVSHERG